MNEKPDIKGLCLLEAIIMIMGIIMKINVALPRIGKVCRIEPQTGRPSSE